MEPTSVEAVLADRADSEERYVEFLRRSAMSVGVYRLPAGATDQQTPHTEDEVYYVVDGAATVEVGASTYPVSAGDVVFVEKRTEHRFVDIEEDLVTLVFFAPAEGTLSE